MVKMEMLCYRYFNMHTEEKKCLPGCSTRAGATNPKRIQPVSVEGVGAGKFRMPPH